MRSGVLNSTNQSNRTKVAAEHGGEDEKLRCKWIHTIFYENMKQDDGNDDDGDGRRIEYKKQRNVSCSL